MRCLLVAKGTTNMAGQLIYRKTTDHLETSQVLYSVVKLEEVNTWYTAICNASGVPMVSWSTQIFTRIRFIQSMQLILWALESDDLPITPMVTYLIKDMQPFFIVLIRW